MTTLYHTLFVDRMYSLEHNNMTAAPVIKGNTSGFLPNGASLSISKWRLREIGVWRFKGLSPVKIQLRVRKIHVFMRVSPGKIRSAGAKSRVIGFASTRGHEKQPAETDFKVSHIRGKTTDLATLFVGDVLSVRELHSLALCCQTHLD